MMLASTGHPSQPAAIPSGSPHETAAGTVWQRGGVEIWDAGPADAEEVARLLHDFNVEFDTPSPGVDVLAPRLRGLLAEPSTVALLAGRPAVAVALVTFRTNVWYEGPVALLDELYVVPHLRDEGIGTAVLGRLFALADERAAGLIEINVDEGDVDTRRFYERHGFQATEAGSDERAFYYWMELE
jgi:GNAT superfamily N-acetyltransferase